MTRKIRLKQNEKAVSIPQKIVRSAENLIEQEYAGLSLSDAEVMKLIDFVSDTNDKASALSAKASAAKKLLLSHVKEVKTKQIVTKKNKLSVSASTTSTVGSAIEFIQILKKEGKSKKQINAISSAALKVGIGEAKKYLGEETLREYKFYSTETKPFGSVTVKRL